MILITCVDDALGVGFNSRRQSRDRAIYADLAALCEGRAIHMSPSSAKLFRQVEGLPIHTFDPQLQTPQRGALYFLEGVSLSPWAGEAQQLILYRWNRSYPADVYLDIPLEDWQLTESVQFPGTSHETITREVYIRETA